MISKHVFMKISIYVGFVLSLFHCRNIKFATDVIFTRKSKKTLFRELQDSRVSKSVHSALAPLVPFFGDLFFSPL